MTINLRVSIGGCLLLDGNPKGYEVEEHILKKFKVNPQMLSTSKNEKFIWSIKPGGIFETSVVGPLGIFIFLGQEKNRAGLFQVREILWETFHE